jgi:hypothetical protein
LAEEEAAKFIVGEVAAGAEGAEVFEAEVGAVAVEVGAVEEDDGAAVGGDGSMRDPAVLAAPQGSFKADVLGDAAPGGGRIEGMVVGHGSSSPVSVKVS